MSRSSTTTDDDELLPNPHPGEILLQEFLLPMQLSQNALARAIHVPPRRINEIVLGKRVVTADTDLRLARYFGLSEGFFLGLQAAGWPGLSLVLVASVAGQIGSQTDPPYSASKAANINFAQCLAKDLAPHGVRVNTVCPGMVRTALNHSVWKAWYDQAHPRDRLTYDAWSDRKIRAVVPLGRWQTPEAVADMIVFLSSERAAHVTGQTINVDGGFVMHW